MYLLFHRPAKHQSDESHLTPTGLDQSRRRRAKSPKVATPGRQFLPTKRDQRDKTPFYNLSMAADFKRRTADAAASCNKSDSVEYETNRIPFCIQWIKGSI